MTSKKSKGSKSDSRSKKRSHNTTPNSSTVIDEKKSSQADIHVSDSGLHISNDELSVGNDQVNENIIEPEIIYSVFSNEPTLTELIIEKYEGEKSNGRFEGLGTAVFVNGNVYEGMFSEGTMNGTGKYIWIDECTSYEGDFSYNEISGKGKYSWSDGSSYEGDVLRGIRHGQGTYKHSSGKMYSGLWVNGKRHGIGIMSYDNEGKSFYEGEWNQNVIEGLGFRQYRSGNSYEGEWYKGLRHGHGTMKWLDRNEQYIGQWKHGIQNGIGQHLWFVQRIKGSQYSLRNVYDGDFVNGKRDGYGTFIYPSGARYEGNWVDNKKCGTGSFVFKNGRNYEGEFEDDKVKEFPYISLSGRDSPDLIFRKTQQSMQDDIDNLSARLSVCSVNTVSPSFQLYLDYILMDSRILNPDEESIQIHKAVLLYIGPIRKIYQFYSLLGDTDSKDNTSVMTQMQFWRFLKDCRLHYNGGPTVAALDRLLAESVNTNSWEIIQNPTTRILLLSFVNYLISIAYFVYKDNYNNYDDVAGNLLAKCFDDFMNKNVLPFACVVGGVLYSNKRKTDEVLTHFNELFATYKEFSYPKMNFSHYYSMKMRDFLVMMKKLELISVNLTAAEIVRILSLDDPNITDGQFVCLENEITFYEFYEAMINCATVFVTKDIIDFHLKPEVNKPPSIHATNLSENMDDSETERTLTLSRPITGDSNKLDIQDEDKNNIHNQGKPLSGKVKLSSAESGNSKNRKSEHEKNTSDKNSSIKKPIKTGKVSKTPNTRNRKPSMDKDSLNTQKSAVPTIEMEKIIIGIPEVNIKDDESLSDSFSQVKTSFPESETHESNEERQFNFWTHQLHIFFYKYLFPAATKYSSISRKISDKTLTENPNQTTIVHNMELSSDIIVTKQAEFILNN